MNIKKSTYYVNFNSLETISRNNLTFYVNQMENEDVRRFANWLSKIIDDQKLSKERIAKEAGILPGSLSRILTGGEGSGIKKERASKLINAVNTVANKEIANKNFGLAVWAGIDLPSFVFEIDFSIFDWRDLMDIETFIKYKRYLIEHPNERMGSLDKTGKKTVVYLNSQPLETKKEIIEELQRLDVAELYVEDGDAQGDENLRSVIDALKSPVKERVQKIRRK